MVIDGKPYALTTKVVNGKPRTTIGPAKPSKYRSRKVVQNGIQFDSAKEARRWAILEQWAKIGAITDLRRQVAFELIPKQRRADGKAERACSYVADFSYVENGQTITEDVKGMKTREYVIKRKLMLHVHGIHIKEV